MQSNHTLAELLGIQPGEGRLVRRLFLFALSNGAARTLMRSAAYALFLAEFSAQLLPYTYIGASLIAALASLSYLHAVRRVALARLLPATLLGVMLAFVGMRLGLAAGAGSWLIFALPIGHEVLLVMTNLALWNSAGQLVNMQQGKRLFGLIAAGEPAAAVVGGFLMPPLVALIGTPNLLLLAAAAVLGALLIALALIRAYPAELARAATPPPAAMPQAGRGLGRSRYVLLTLSLFSLAIIGYYFIDNLFYMQTQAQLANTNQLAGFIGVFNAVVAIAWTLTNAFVLGAVARRFGLRALLLIAPLLLAAGTLAIVVAGGLGAALTLVFGLAALNKLLSKLSYDGFVKLSLNIIYQPLPAAQRAQAQALTEGMVYAGAVGLAGVLLLALSYLAQLSPIDLAVVLLVVIAAWLGLAALLLREYPAQLLRALARRTLGDDTPALVDPASRAVLRQALSDPRPEVAIYALRALAAGADDALPGLLPGLLRHPAAPVRQQALLAVERSGDAAALDTVAELIAAEPAADVRGEAIRVLATHRGNTALATITPFLASPDPAIRLGATVGLLRGGGIAGVLAAGQQLLGWAAAPDPGARAAAAQALGQVGVAAFDQPLLELLRDPDSGVRRAALFAAGRVCSPRLWPEVVAALAAPASAKAAAMALVAGGQAALPALATAFATAEPALAGRIAQVCGRIGGDAAALLATRADIADPAARGQVLRALERLEYRPAPEARARLLRQLQAEVALGAGTLAALEDCAGAGLLADALQADLAATRERVLSLLGLLSDAQAIARARAPLLRGSAEQRAYALEVIETQVDAELRALALPLLGDGPPDKWLRQLAAATPQRRIGMVARLAELIANADGQHPGWVRACAIYSAAMIGAPELAEAIRPLAASADPLLRETAQWALGQGSPHTTTPHNGSGAHAMLSRIEKVLILKTVAIFAETPDEVLADVAGLLHEAEAPAGSTIFRKGDSGTSMFIIIEGEVRVHDGDHTLNHLHTRDVFGEMALLDPEPRVASVTAIADTQLLRLDQEPFYELMDERNEVARGVIRVLTRHLRARVRDLGEARAQLGEAAITIRS